MPAPTPIWLGDFTFEIDDTVVSGGVGDNGMNCDCEVESPYRSLGELRISLMRRLGYAAMVNSPPPGMLELLSEFLQDAQKQLILKNPDLRTTRLFRWPMAIGNRYYDLSEDETSCGVRLRKEAVKWVGFEDSNGQWQELLPGIAPELYTTVDQNGRPARYEIRSCLEIFPGPDAEYDLWVKGEFGPTAFVNAEHKTTIDDHLVFLLALGNAKLHYKQRDANDILTQADTYLKGLKAGKHTTKRYIPGVRAQASLPRPEPPEDP